MAPRRLLKTFTKLPAPTFFVMVMASLMIAGCGTSKKAKKTPGSTSGSKSTNKSTAAISDEFASVLDQNRSELDDVYSSQQNSIPAAFKKKADTRDIGNPNKGYRIQILSTRNVARADSVAKDFRSWIDAMNLSYVPKAYVFFKQPYYKVHIGNFQFQDQAQKLTRQLKARYPGAWVVHDSIEPKLVPADTTQFRVSQH